MKIRQLRGDYQWHLIRGPGSDGIAYKLERNKYDKDYPDEVESWGTIEIADITDTTGVLDEPDPDGHILITQNTIELKDLPGKGYPGTDILREALEDITNWGGNEWFAKSRTEAWDKIR